MRESSREIPFLLCAAKAPARRGAQESSGIRSTMDLKEKSTNPSESLSGGHVLFCPSFLDTFRLRPLPGRGSLGRGSHLAADQPGDCRKQNAHGYSAHEYSHNAF